jgi:hypothetical protein
VIQRDCGQEIRGELERRGARAARNSARLGQERGAVADEGAHSAQADVSEAGEGWSDDASRIRKNPGVFARMRSFAYNILRINQSDTIAQDRYAAALGGLKFLFSMKLK